MFSKHNAHAGGVVTSASPRGQLARRAVQRFASRGHIAALVVAVAAAGSIAGGVSSEAQAASWLRGSGASTDAALVARCNTSYRPNGTKVWSVEVTLWVFNPRAGDVLDTYFAVGTTGGFNSGTLSTRTTFSAGMPAYRYVVYNRFFARSDEVQVVARFRLNGVLFPNSEFASHYTAIGSDSSWTGNSCFLF